MMGGLIIPLVLGITSHFWPATRSPREHMILAASTPLALAFWLWLYANLTLSVKPDLQPLLLVVAGLGIEALRALDNQRSPRLANLLAGAANLCLLAAFIFRSLLSYTALPLLAMLLFLFPLLWRASHSTPDPGTRVRVISGVLLLAAAALPFINRNWLPEIGIPASLGVFMVATADLQPAAQVPTSRGWLTLRQLGLLVITVSVALHFLQFR